MTPKTRSRLIAVLVLAIPVVFFVISVIYKGLFEK